MEQMLVIPDKMKIARNISTSLQKVLKAAGGANLTYDLQGSVGNEYVRYWNVSVISQDNPVNYAEYSTATQIVVNYQSYQLQTMVYKKTLRPSGQLVDDLVHTVYTGNFVNEPTTRKLAARIAAQQYEAVQYIIAEQAAH